MELLNQVFSQQFLFPAAVVGTVLLCAILVFVFGFKSAEQPSFDKLSSTAADDRKPAGKKRKIKEKKSNANGNAASLTEVDSKHKVSEVKTSPAKKTGSKEKAVVKEAPVKQLKDKKPENSAAAKPADKKAAKAGKGKENKEIVEGKNKKNAKPKQPEEKPLDFDDGNWETVPTKNDKKNRKNQEEIIKIDSPKKLNKKNKKADIPSPTIDNKISEVTKELKDKVNEQQKAAAEVDKNIEILLSPVEVLPPVEESIKAVVDDSKKKKAKKSKAKTEESEKSVEVAPAAKKEKKKAQKIPEADRVSDEPEVKKPQTVVDQAVAFDELGDVWTEAKAPKKGKKKARKE